MSRMRWYVVGAVAVVAALALGLAFGLAGGQEQSTPLAQGGAAPGGGINEGVQVHGHWTLEVRDPDGSLVSRHEFENALGDLGESALARVLTGWETAGHWEIYLKNDPLSGSPFRDEVGDPANGFIVDPSCNCSGVPWRFCNLNESFNFSTSVITLTGWAQAQADGNISSVQTVAYTCQSNVSPSQCNCSNWFAGYQFTNTTLPQPVELAANQWVTATVNISFQ